MARAICLYTAHGDGYMDIDYTASLISRAFANQIGQWSLGPFVAIKY